MSMSFSKRVREKMNSVTFCYAKDGGQGFTENENCECDKEKCCQAFLDQERFYKRFEELQDDMERDEIIQIIKQEFKESKWWKDNVIE